MGWTDERVELLKKLWGDGLSASQIAKRLGGISRNAVIGKVNRLGLSGRAPASKPARAAKTRPAGRAVSPSPLRPAGNRVYVQPETKPLPPERDEAPGTCTVLTLGAYMCKWPIGDPSQENFTFCGRRAGDGPYCVEHTQTAHQPATAKKRSSGAELARSLRRYI